MQLLGFVSLIIYDIFILYYFRMMFPEKRSHWFYYAGAAVVINMGVTIPSYLFLDHRFAVFLMMGSMMLAFQLLFHGNRIQILYAGSIYIFSLYSSKGIIFSIYSMVLHSSIKDVLQHELYYETIFALAVLLSILTSLFIRKVVLPDEKARHLLHNRGQLRFVVIYLIFELVFLMLINDGRYHDEISQSWLSSLYLGACVIGKLWLMFVFNHTSKATESLEYELHTRKLQEQLSRQMRHYQSYQKYTESFRVFRHDYVKLMTSVKILMRNQDFEKAARMLDEIHDTMQRDVLVHKTYSDNIILDAILQDEANSCEEKGIRFSAVTHLPENIMKELDIVRVFSNIIDNAIDACNKLSGPDRYIEITSDANEDWITIEVSNSFNGDLNMVNDMPETTKEDKDFHGLGLRIVTETIEGLGGLVFIEPDQIKKIFRIRLCIPKASS
ncbi:sensor histidine kinase [Desulfotomaculum sp. 1211_IL3151]|uniref:sensor histidine kinase n=1 Tax=Desulfotomaculum sp. 1211_IL3151 TaxID=3084055 RepID=UPI002FDB524B